MSIGLILLLFYILLNLLSLSYLQRCILYIFMYIYMYLYMLLYIMYNVELMEEMQEFIEY